MWNASFFSICTILIYYGSFLWQIFFTLRKREKGNKGNQCNTEYTVRRRKQGINLFSVCFLFWCWCCEDALLLCIFMNVVNVCIWKKEDVTIIRTLIIMVSEELLAEMKRIILSFFLQERGMVVRCGVLPVYMYRLQTTVYYSFLLGKGTLKCTFSKKTGSLSHHYHQQPYSPKGFHSYCTSSEKVFLSPSKSLEWIE